VSELHEELSQRLTAWRMAGYPCAYPAIGEILEYALENEELDQPFPASGSLRFLRTPQLRALETYWYLRLVELTPHIRDLYQRMFSSAKARREALGLTSEALRGIIEDEGLPTVIDRIATDDDFAQAHRPEGAREARWVLMDYLDAVVHIFTPDAREFYRLEQLWGEAPSRGVD